MITTLVPRQQSSSSVPERIHFAEDPSSPAIVPRRGWRVGKTTGRVVGTFDDLPLTGGSTSPATGIRGTFAALAAQWKQETHHLSSPTTIAMHPAYQQIIGLGSVAIPLILEDLQQEAPAYWFCALRALTNESPVQAEDRGDIEAMRAAWIDWGKRRRYLPTMRFICKWR